MIADYQQKIATNLTRLRERSGRAYRDIHRDFESLTGDSVALTTIIRHFETGNVPMANAIAYISVLNSTLEEFLNME